MKQNLYFIIFGILIFTSSCTRKVLIQEAYFIEDKTEEQSKDRVDIRTYYVGDDGYNISFQIDIDNRSDSIVVLSEEDIELELIYEGRRRDILTPLRKDVLIASLEYEENRLEEEKKYDTAANVIMSGVGILGGIFSGASGIGTVIYGSGSAVDIIARRSEYGAAQGSISEQVAYHKKYTLDKAIIEAGSKASFDIHFEKVLTNCYSELVIFYGDQNHVSEYEFVIEELRVRR